MNRNRFSVVTFFCRAKICFGFALGVLLSLSAFAATNEIPKEPDVLRATLTNGLQVIIVHNPLAPVVTTVVNYRVGSDETPEGFPGTAHALEHMMFRGSPGLSGDQLADVSAALGGDFNADTQQAVTQYFFTTPAEDLDLALHVEAERMRGLAQDEKLWEKERGAIEQEVAQDLSNPEYVFYMKLLQVMFKGTPYEHDALGTRPSFDKTTGADLRKFHSDWYRPNNAILVVAGDVPLEPTLAKVKEIFAGIPSGKLPARPEYNFQPVKSDKLSIETDLPYGMAAITFRFPGFDSPDFAAAQVLADVLSSRRGEIYGLVPEGKALMAEFSYETLPRSGLGYAMAAYPAGGNGEDLVAQLRAILLAKTTNGLSPDLVEAAKRREIASAEFQRNSVSGLAMEWSSAVAIEGRNSPQDDVEAIRKVTVADVNRVAKQLLDMDHAVTAILTPQPSGKPVSTKSFGGAESFASGESKGVKLPDWATAAVNRLDVPKLTVNPTVTNLPNGLKLIIQPEAVSDTVCVYGRVKNRPKVEMAKGKDGVDQALDQLFSFGTKSLNRLAYEKALDEIGATESAGADFSIQVLTADFDRGMQLLADNELSPALPEKAFELIQPELAGGVAGELESPGYRAERAVETSLFPTNDPIHRETTPETIKGLSIQDVRNYYQQTFRPDLTTLVIIGKVTPEHASAVAMKYFGGWKASGPKPNTLFPPAPTNAPAILNVPDASRVQNKVTLAETLGLTRTNDDYYALELGNHVLGGAFYATRFYRDLRKNAGLVYFVSSDFQVGLTRGVYEIAYACDPPNVFKARSIVARDLSEMRTNNVTDEELRQAKVLLLRKIPLSEASFDQIANGWISRTELDLPLDEPIHAAHRYLDLKADDVRAAFARWIRPEDFVQVSQGPEPK
ncbi:MAG TPA: pitrilysin family protein [Verrucomicrobiae bacterium]|nr:pitrilysin family protein [Verrucomicrobiae bacterium]